MKLEDLQTCISEMSTEDLNELLSQIRHNKTSEAVVVKKEKSNKSKQSELDKLIASLSPAQLAKLMEGM